MGQPVGVRVPPSAPLIRRASALAVTLLLLLGDCAAARIATAQPSTTIAPAPTDPDLLTIDFDRLDRDREADGVLIFSGAVVVRQPGWLLTAERVTACFPVGDQIVFSLNRDSTKLVQGCPSPPLDSPQDPSLPDLFSEAPRAPDRTGARGFWSTGQRAGYTVMSSLTARGRSAVSAAGRLADSGLLKPFPRIVPHSFLV